MGYNPKVVLVLPATTPSPFDKSLYNFPDIPQPPKLGKTKPRRVLVQSQKSYLSSMLHAQLSLRLCCPGCMFHANDKYSMPFSRFFDISLLNDNVSLNDDICTCMYYNI